MGLSSTKPVPLKEKYPTLTNKYPDVVAAIDVGKLPTDNKTQYALRNLERTAYCGDNYIPLHARYLDAKNQTLAEFCGHWKDRSNVTAGLAWRTMYHFKLLMHDKSDEDIVRAATSYNEKLLESELYAANLWK